MANPNIEEVTIINEELVKLRAENSTIEARLLDWANGINNVSNTNK